MRKGNLGMGVRNRIGIEKSPKKEEAFFFIIIIFRIVMSKLQYYLNIFSTVMYHSIVII